MLDAYNQNTYHIGRYSCISPKSSAQISAYFTRAEPGFYVKPGRPFHDRADGSGSTRAQRTLFAALGLRVTSSLVETETCVVLWREPRLSSQREAQRRACAPSGHALRPPCPLRRQVGMLVEAIDALSCDRSGARTPCSSDS